MAREILFKAKRIDNGKWVEGYYFYNANIKKHYIKTWICYYEVDQETICQYTGLTDKNGKKIWENDICYYDDMDICVIRFGKYDNNTGHKHIGFYTDWQQYKDLYRHDLGFWVAECEVEVIGNIFDNPELLEG